MKSALQQPIDEQNIHEAPAAGKNKSSDSNKVNEPEIKIQNNCKEPVNTEEGNIIYSVKISIGEIKIRKIPEIV